MKIINDGLPGPVYDLIANDSYSRGSSDISITELISPPRIRALTEKHYDKIEVNASSLLAVTLGKAFHSDVERATKTGIAERRLFIEKHGWKISGGMDHLDTDNNILTDYKVTNVWKLVYSNGTIEEYEKQLNCYAQILRENGERINKLKIFMLFKDWRGPDFKTYLRKGKIFIPSEKGGYPEKSWLYIELPLWDEEKALGYINERVLLHQGATNLLPKCGADETWAGRRCAEYCDVSKFCDQYNQATKTGLIEG